MHTSIIHYKNPLYEEQQPFQENHCHFLKTNILKFHGQHRLSTKRVDSLFCKFSKNQLRLSFVIVYHKT